MEIATSQTEEVSKYEIPRTLLAGARKRWYEMDCKPAPPGTGRDDPLWKVSLRLDKNTWLLSFLVPPFCMDLVGRRLHHIPPDKGA